MTVVHNQYPHMLLVYFWSRIFIHILRNQDSVYVKCIDTSKCIWNFVGNLRF